MNLCISDFESLKAAAINELDQRLQEASPGNCWEFECAVNRLESELLLMYRMAALLARRETDMATTATIWKTMVGLCDTFASKVLSLSAEHPACRVSYDKILDVRNECLQLEELHSG